MAIESCDFYWRYSVNDAVYGPGRIAIPASASSASYVGTTVDIQTEWAISRQLFLSGYIAHFSKGPVVRDANGQNVDYVGVWVTFKF